MKNLFFVTAFFLSAILANAQSEVAKNDNKAASQPTRLRLGANATRMGQTDNAGFFSPFATVAEVTQATGGSINNVNGKTGPTVTLVTTDVAEGVNLYYTQLRARSAFSATGPINLNTATGVFSFSGTPADVQLGNVNNTSDANKPISTAVTTALGSKEPTLPTGTTAQYLRGDKTLATLDKAAVLLPNVDNTSDANKPLSSANVTALNLKADAVSVIPINSVSTYANLTGTIAPATGFLKFIRVATDERYSETNSLYIVDSTGKISKVTLIPEN